MSERKLKPSRSRRWRQASRGRVDDQRRLAELLPRLDEPGDAFERHEATPRIS
jgi:hypothetical protein